VAEPADGGVPDVAARRAARLARRARRQVAAQALLPVSAAAGRLARLLAEIDSRSEMAVSEIERAQDAGVTAEELAAAVEAAAERHGLTPELTANLASLLGVDQAVAAVAKSRSRR
jgi:hypothetical protein